MIDFFLSTLISPLNINHKIDTNEHDDLCDELSGIAFGKNIPRLVCDIFGGDGSQSAALHIKNVEKLFVIANNKNIDGTTPTNSTPTEETKEKKKKYRRNRDFRNKYVQFYEHKNK